MSPDCLQHTLNHFNCSACLQLGPMKTLDAAAPFAQACTIWLETHQQYIKPSTYKVYRAYGKALSEFFQDLALREFHVGNIRAYQRWRSERACAMVINAEVMSVLIPMLREAEVWNRIRDVYRNLPVAKKKVRQSMGDDEERRFLLVALDASRPKRLLAGHCLVIMENTSMGFGELRHLKREDVILNDQIPYVTVNEGTKNDFRIRTIPLNWVALRSMKWILRRWEELGGTEPSQYILPLRGKRAKGQKQPISNFRAPMSGIYRAAHAIFREAGLGHFVPYDMRSCAVTKILSDPGVSDQMAQEIIGHSNTITKRRYSRQRLEKKAVAMEKLALDPEPALRFVVFPGGRK